MQDEKPRPVHVYRYLLPSSFGRNLSSQHSSVCMGRREPFSVATLPPVAHVPCSLLAAAEFHSSLLHRSNYPITFPHISSPHQRISLHQTSLDISALNCAHFLRFEWPPRVYLSREHIESDECRQEGEEVLYQRFQGWSASVRRLHIFTIS